MKKLSFLVFALSTSLITSIQANETAPAPCPPAPCPCPLAFAGFSLGGTVGYGIGNANVKSAATYTTNARVGAIPTSYSVSSQAYPGLSGVDGGLIAGYLHRFGNWGVGTDFLANWASTSGSRNTTAGFTQPDEVVIQASSVSVKMKNSLQVRGVFSYVVSELLMPKVMLGWDNSQYTLTSQQPLALAFPGGSLESVAALGVTQQKRLNGLLWGAGIDFLVAQNVVFGLEYTGVISTKTTVNASSNSTIPYAGVSYPVTGTSSASLRPQYNTFKATLKYVPGLPTYEIVQKKPTSSGFAPYATAFQGFSLGGTLGYGIGKATTNSATNFSFVSAGDPGQLPFNITSKPGLSGVDGGLITGYLQRFGNWGVGADFLANWASTYGSENDTAGWFTDPTHQEVQTASLNVKMKNALQVRGVFSYVLSNLMMPKIMLGWDNSQYTLAYQQVTTIEGGAVGSSIITQTKRLNGFLWGAGVDFLVAKDIVFGLEYTGVMSTKMTVNSPFSGITSAAAGGGAPAPFTATSSVSLQPQYNTFKGTLKYIF